VIALVVIATAISLVCAIVDLVSAQRRANARKFDLRALERGARARSLNRDHHPLWTSGGWTECHSCGTVWKNEAVRRWWPIAFVIARHSSWGTHGIEIDSDGIERPIVATVLSLWRLRVVFGKVMA